MAKPCNKDGCSYFQFGGGYCKLHQRLRSDEIKPTRHDNLKLGYNPAKKRSSILAKYSVSKQAKKNKLAEIKKRLIEETGSKSFFTGKVLKQPDLFHIFPIGKYPEYETEDWNVVLSERWINRTWDQGTWEEIKKIPNVEKIKAIIYYRDNCEDKLHLGSFYEQLMNRKNK